MLILTRTQGQRIFVRYEDKVEVIITVVETKQGRVRLGFEAPSCIQIDREEVRVSKDKGRTYA